MDSIDWKALERLRALFLAGNAGAADYWETDADLASYDATFAQRIGWKWDDVLSELQRRGWTPPGGRVLDWGCGSGIAGRAYCDRFDAQRVYLADRSPRAMQFAARRLRERFPTVDVWQESLPPPAVDVLLISHVLTEQPAPWTLPCAATTVIIVEPGTREASQRLIALRESLRDRYHAVAPCTHNAACGLAGQERHWCHQFAPVPAAVFRDPDWARFSQVTGIDLRRLPVSYLVLDQRPPATLPSGATRVIGAPRVYKAHALALGCDATGVHERRLTKRALPDEFRRWKKGGYDSLQNWRLDGDDIVGC